MVVEAEAAAVVAERIFCLLVFKGGSEEEEEGRKV